MGKFDTPLSPGQEEAFQFWKQENAPNDSDLDYDLRGAFLSRATPGPQWLERFRKPVVLNLRHVGGDVKQKSTTPISGDVSYGEIGKQHARHRREGEFADSFLGKLLAALGVNNDNESR